MDETNPQPPAPAPLDPHQLSPRRVKRRLMVSLVVLHALSLFAAAVLVLRAKDPAPKGEKKALLSSLAANKETVGWVTIRGPIMAGETGRPWERGAEQWARRIEQLAETKGVKAIVLDINSPGGSVGAVQEIHSRILRVKKEKNIPFVALFGDVSASGGYYLGAACDKIVAHPGTLTGSIGVIFSVTNLEGLFTKIGFKQDPIKSGKHKDIGSPARPMTAEERQLLQAMIDDTYGQFVGAVAEGRKMSVEEVKPLADGRIYTGTQALQLKLVDQLGDSKDALMLAAKLGGIKDEKPKVRRDVERMSDLFELLETKARLTLGLGALESPLARLQGPGPGLHYLWTGW
ncbi:MAG: signal peptide peptidase SppA [Elusimicrobiota bacterium]|nr:signal peptide peptidase SppA [Elusimicrobiota bacterium]